MKKFLFAYRVKLLIIITIMLIGSSLLMVSYAYYNYKVDHLEKNTTLNATFNCAKVTFSSNFLPQYFSDVPKHDYDAMKERQILSINVKNTCNYRKNVGIYFIPFTNSTMENTSVKYYVRITRNYTPFGGYGPYWLSSSSFYMTGDVIRELQLSESGYSTENFKSYASRLDLDYADPNDYVQYDIYFWIDYYEGGLNNTTYGKTLDGNFFIYTY